VVLLLGTFLLAGVGTSEADGLEQQVHFFGGQLLLVDWAGHLALREGGADCDGFA
jgi:hypothetical protein